MPPTPSVIHFDPAKTQWYDTACNDAWAAPSTEGDGWVVFFRYEPQRYTFATEHEAISCLVGWLFDRMTGAIRHAA